MHMRLTASRAEEAERMLWPELHQPGTLRAARVAMCELQVTSTLVTP
jgi:hypothetical protein